MGQRPPERIFLIGAVEIDVARKQVAAGSAIDAGLEPVERHDAGQDQIVVAPFAAPDLAGGLARHEHRAGLGAVADPRVDAVPAWRRAERVLFAADAVSRRRHRPSGDRLARFEPDRELALGVDHQQPLRQRGRRALARQALARKIERAGGNLLGKGGHGRTLP